MNCIGPQCERIPVSRGMCLAHYKQNRNGRTLVPLFTKKGGHLSRSPEQRFWEKVNTSNINGCPWIWTGAKTNKGHGSFSLNGKRGEEKFTSPHRFVYQLFYGDIPNGFDIDHMCHNLAAYSGLCAGGITCLHRICVYPEHLEAKSRQENLLASPLTLTSRMVSGEIILPYFSR